MSGGYHFWLGASADADPATRASHGAASASPPSGECPLREEWLERFSNLYRDEAVERVAKAIAQPIIEEFDGLEYGKAVKWDALPEREKIPLRFIALRGLRAAVNYAHTAKPK